MKKIIAYSFNLLFLVTFLASCLGDLDTMPLDNNQLVSDQVYKTKDGYTGVLAKCYSSLILTGQQGGDGGNGDLEGANEGYSGYVRLLFYLQEMSTDNFLMPSSFSFFFAGAPGRFAALSSPPGSLVLPAPIPKRFPNWLTRVFKFS